MADLSDLIKKKRQARPRSLRDLGQALGVTAACVADAIAIVNILEGIERSYGIYRNSGVVPVIPDPGYSSVNVAKRLSPEEFTDFMIQVKTAAATARKAFDDQNESTSRGLWRQLFGQNFG
jgi:hypothetical protein